MFFILYFLKVRAAKFFTGRCSLPARAPLPTSLSCRSLMQRRRASIAPPVDDDDIPQVNLQVMLKSRRTSWQRWLRRRSKGTCGGNRGAGGRGIGTIATPTLPAITTIYEEPEDASTEGTPRGTQEEGSGTPRETLEEGSGTPRGTLEEESPSGMSRISSNESSSSRMTRTNSYESNYNYNDNNNYNQTAPNHNTNDNLASSNTLASSSSTLLTRPDSFPRATNNAIASVDIEASSREGREEEGRAGEWVMLEVSVADTGIGIDPSILSKLFRPYAQATVSTMREYP